MPLKMVFTSTQPVLYYLGAPIELLCGSDYWVCLTLEITPSIIVSSKSINGVVKLLKIYVHCNN